MLNKKKAFTLAELMLVFTVIGILTAILVPGLFLASPDKDELKAKKAYNTITRAVQTLLNSDPYVETGNLDASSYISGTTDDNKKARNSFFCSNLTNVLSVSNANCSFDWVNNAFTSNYVWCPHSYATSDSVEMTSGASSSRVALCASKSGNDIDYPTLANNIDTACNNYYTSLTGTTGRNTQYNFKTPDGVIWGIQLQNFSNNQIANVNNVNIKVFHGVVCFSTDNLKKQEHMYGLGIRQDGVILAGTKLANLLENEDED